MDKSIEFFKVFIEIGLFIFFSWIMWTVLIFTVDGARTINKKITKGIWKYLKKIKENKKPAAESPYLSALIKESKLVQEKITLNCCEVIHNQNYEPQEEFFILEILNINNFTFRKNQRIYIEYKNGECICNGEFIYGVNPYLIDMNGNKIFWTKE